MSPSAPNNGMHPTANQLGCHRELGRTSVVCAAGDAGRWALPIEHHSALMNPDFGAAVWNF